MLARVPGRGSTAVCAQSRLALLTISCDVNKSLNMIVYMYMYIRIISGIFLQTFCSCRSARIEQLGDESVRFVHLDDSVPSVGRKHRSFSSATTDDNSSCIQTNIYRM